MNYIYKQVTENVTSYFFRRTRYQYLYKYQFCIEILGNFSISWEQEWYFQLNLVKKIEKNFYLSILGKNF
jgi:hypothetical protein